MSGRTLTSDRRIAIVGMAGIFPGASSPGGLWESILAGQSAVSSAPAERRMIPWVFSNERGRLTEGVDPLDRVCSDRACFVQSEAIDWRSVGVNPELARRLDPAFQIAALAIRHALQDCVGRHPDPNRMGVIAGNIVLPTDCVNARTAERISEEIRSQLGQWDDETVLFRDRFDEICLNAAHGPIGFGARTARLGGLTLAIDAACASSLYALKLASDELLNGRADAMLAGGVSRPDWLYTQCGFERLGALSRRGVCAPFDANADGIVVGEGAGMFVLKRLADAERDGDRIYGVLCGFGLSNDVGGRLLAPDSEGQLRALKQAYRQAGWRPDDVDLIECHATGTPVGDAVETASLTRLWRESASSANRSAVIGSVKSNVGHLLTAAGAAGLAKLLSALNSAILPPTANFEKPHPNLRLEDSPFEVLSRPREWPRRSAGEPRRAAINGFGFGGINAHVLIEEYFPDRYGRTAFIVPEVPTAAANEHDPRQTIAVVAIQALVGGAHGVEEFFESAFGFRSAIPLQNTEGLLHVPVDRFRIPPKELEDILPQQLLMLLAADGAAKMAGWRRGPKPRAGAFIGLELDGAATRFHSRWGLPPKAQHWIEKHVGEIDGSASQRWIRELQDAASPPLTANRVMGALGGIVASRVGRELEIGGPCHAVACEEASGLAALEIALDALATHEIDEALVGAVDADIATAGAGDGSGQACAAALILMRVDDAVGRGLPIWALVSRAGSSSDVDAVEVVSPDQRVFIRGNFPVLDAEASRKPLRWSELGGAAGGMAALVQSVLAVGRAMIPNVANPTAWLRDRDEEVRRCVVEAIDRFGKRRRIAVVEPPQASMPPWRPALPAVAAQKRPRSTGPSMERGKLAFVFAGTGNHYPGMGRALAAHFPDILRRHEKSTARLCSQMQPERFWPLYPPERWDAEVRPLIVGQVAWSILATEAMMSLGISPGAAIGYSLGESSALFALGAWSDRDGMFARMKESPLFESALCGRCDAARREWNLAADESVDWVAGVVNAGREKVGDVIHGMERVYLLIVNSPGESVIGGDRTQVEEAVRRLRAQFVALRGVSTVHCAIASHFADEYRTLHLLPTTAPKGIDFYSSAWRKRYALDRQNAADAILAQALETVDFKATIEAAYDDGVRTFVEIGPGNSCSRMIAATLAGKEHWTFAPFVQGKSEVEGLVELAGSLRQSGWNVDSERWKRIGAPLSTPTDNARVVSVPLRRTVPRVRRLSPAVVNANAAYPSHKKPSAGEQESGDPSPEVPAGSAVVVDATNDEFDAHSAAHEAFLRFSRQAVELYAQQTLLQAHLMGGANSFNLNDSEKTIATADWPSGAVELGGQDIWEPVGGAPKAMDRRACLEFGAGSAAASLGPLFAGADAFPTRVRLPDVPLNFVDRVLLIDAEPLSMTSGNVVTEHGVLAGAWYLDEGVMPTCFAVEAGQADLLLSGYLGIDFVTKGEAVYRLLDAKVTFHRGLPRPGETIRYDIWIDGFFNQGATHLFRFRFEGTAGGEPLLSMRDGCAGFFTRKELDSGRGIVQTELDKRPQPGKITGGWRPFANLTSERYSDPQLDALRRGDLAGAFGEEFAGLAIERPMTLPGGKLKLIDRIAEFDPTGGRYGIGRIRAESDIHPDDWFIVCHFVDDPVMPGTLMYECCLHTLRVYLLRIGWIVESGEGVWEPVPGVTSSLKCRGQVIGQTRVAAYEVSIKEIGYRPEPYVVVDALMFADGRPIVEIGNMSLRMEGLDKDRFEALWRRRQSKPKAMDAGSVESPSPLVKPHSPRRVLFDHDRIRAFAVGNPSDAFGDRYRPFDRDRIIARLPGPPYQFLDRIVGLEGEPWQMTAGAACVAEYDVPPDAWYFDDERTGLMPFSVLLEVALQPCGWLAAYVGSALTSEIDLSFRNLGGNARHFRPVARNCGTLTAEARMTKCSASGGMIIQHYDMRVSSSGGLVYEGDTYFGFFSKAALANQVGIRDVKLHSLESEERRRARRFSYPTTPPFPGDRLRMIDEVEAFDPEGGARGLGFLRGTKGVDPSEWFFAAHFYQDPVCPGSLGLESFLQLLKAAAVERWGMADGLMRSIPGFSTAHGSPTTHRWIYRGQVIPTDRLVTVEATITRIDDRMRCLTADGFLSVDGRTIYQMTDFSIQLLETGD